jgi:NADPH:quinone reductase-like Zn-dependent oxidoreductase
VRTIKAIVITEFGSDPARHDLENPQAAENEVLIDVEYSSINGMDIMTWNGMVQHMMPFELPITLGRDFSGTVAGLGPGVNGLSVGDEVFGVYLSVPLHAGTFAEQLAAPAVVVSKRPEGLDAKAAGALGWAGNAAKTAIDAIAPKGGDTVLICGASGGVGAIALQLAKGRGATVIATATRDKVEFVRDLGADETVDYTKDLSAGVRQLRPSGVEAALHLAGDGLAVADLVAPGGRMASTLGIGPDQVAAKEISATAVMSTPTKDALDELAASVVKRELRVPITKTFNLEEAAHAIKEFAAGSLGKYSIVVR